MTLRELLESGYTGRGKWSLADDGKGHTILWIEPDGSGFTLNDDRTSSPIGLDEDLTEITDEWLRVTA